MAQARSYPAIVEAVTDADTAVVLADLGFDTWRRTRVRLAGINARELSDPGGVAARDHLADLLPIGAHVGLWSLSYDKFGGRVVGRIHLRDDKATDVGERMITDGYAARWNGRGERPVPPWPIPEVSPKPT